MGLLEQLRRAFANAEVSLLGAGEERQEAERALAAGEWFKARAAARRLLDRAPRSPIGLALLADACEPAGLDAELEEALVALSKSAAASPDVWVRLGAVRARVGAPVREVRDAYARAVAWDDDADPELRFVARRARLALADLELAEGNVARAEGWLAPIDDTLSDVTRRRLACAIARKSHPDLARIVASFTPDVSDAEGQRLVGEASSILGDASTAARSLARAAILGDGRAVNALRETVARSRGVDASALRAVETVAKELRLDDAPLWRAALASARGDAATAASALKEALDAPPASGALQGPADRAAARAVAVAARDEALLARILAGGGEGRDEIDGSLVDAARALKAGPTAGGSGLDALLRPHVGGEDAERAAWAGELAHALVERGLAPKEGNARWEIVVERLAGHARALGDLEALRRLEQLAGERARPVRIAIVGEFNAGKSTFVNALLSMDVAPTGILPTTAVAHVLRFGPDPIARARLKAGGARTVPPDRLKALLNEIDPTTIEEVEVEVPFPYLQRVEVVDTPGFNAPDPEHAKIAMATLSEGTGVDLAIWLFDANQPLKTSERRVLEAIVARGIPVQALLNKADRLSDDDLAKVVRTFEDDAASIGLKSWRTPLAFSARRAFEARLANDEAKLRESRFEPVRALMEDELPAHQAALKERGLRRRALDVVKALAEAAEKARSGVAAKVDDAARRRAALVQEATFLDRAGVLESARGPSAAEDARADACRRAVRDELRGALDAFRREREELLAKDDPSMAAYLERRLAELVEGASARAMAGALQASGETSREVLDEVFVDAAALGRGYAAAGAGLVDDPALARARGDAEGGLVRALLSVAAARLRARAQREEARADVDAARARELSAFVAALTPRG